MVPFCMIIFALILTSPLFSETNRKSCPEDLIYVTENYPPGNYVDQYGMLKGANVEILKEVWKKLGCLEQEIKVYPWARAYQKVLTQDNHVLFGMSRTKEREPHFKWFGPISSSHHVLIGLKSDKPPITLSNTAEASFYRIGVIRDDVGQKILLNHGVSTESILEHIDLRSTVQGLLNGNVDMVSIGYNAYADLQRNSSEREFYIIHGISSSEIYFAVSKNVPDEVIVQFQTALDSIKDIQLKILKRAGLSLDSNFPVNSK